MKLAGQVVRKEEMVRSNQGRHEADVEDDEALGEMTIRVCAESRRTWLALVHPRLRTRMHIVHNHRHIRDPFIAYNH